MNMILGFFFFWISDLGLWRFRALCNLFFFFFLLGHKLGPEVAWTRQGPWGSTGQVWGAEKKTHLLNEMGWGFRGKPTVGFGHKEIQPEPNPLSFL